MISFNDIFVFYILIIARFTAREKSLYKIKVEKGTWVLKFIVVYNLAATTIILKFVSFRLYFVLCVQSTFIINLVPPTTEIYIGLPYAHCLLFYAITRILGHCKVNWANLEHYEIAFFSREMKSNARRN